MKRFFLFFLIVCLVLSGCAVMPSDPLAYQREEACLLLTGEIDELAFSAELTLSAVTDAGIDARDFTLEYTAPATLAGLTLTRVDGIVTLTRGSVSFDEPGGRFAAMTLPASLFCIDAELGDAAVIQQNGTTLNRLETADDEGEYVLWLDEDGIRRRIEGRVDGRTVAVDILRAPRTEENLS